MDMSQKMIFLNFAKSTIYHLSKPIMLEISSSPKGVLITKKPVNAPVKFEEQEDEQELYDYSQSNYDEIYQYF